MSYHKLFYDDKCPLCIKTVKLIDKIISPAKIQYVKLSSSKLSEEDEKRALSEMLLLSNDGRKFWGYYTYVKLFQISNSSFSLIFRFLSKVFKFPIIRNIGKYTYKKISSHRLRCTDNCNLKTN